MCILLNVKKHEKTFALNVDIFILFEPQENQIQNVMERIFMHYYELCDRENFKPQYEYIKMTEVK